MKFSNKEALEIEGLGLFFFLYRFIYQMKLEHLFPKASTPVRQIYQFNVSVTSILLHVLLGQTSASTGSPDTLCTDLKKYLIQCGYS